MFHIFLLHLTRVLDQLSLTIPKMKFVDNEFHANFEHMLLRFRIAKICVTLHQYKVRFTHVILVYIIVVSTASFPTGFLFTIPFSVFIYLVAVFAQS